METLHGNGNVAANGLQKDADNAPSGDPRALLNILPVGVFVIDSDQRVRTINPAGARILGIEPVEAMGRRCADLFRCSYPGAACASCRARDEQRPQREFPAEIRRANDGARRSVVLDAAPFGNGSVAVLLRDVTEDVRLRRSLADRWVFHGLVCVSSTMKDIVDRIRDVAPYESTVLILGESGTGKELVARAIHAESTRANRPFVAVNCSAYSENLLESELFGHTKGSFTGADRDRLGRFEQADGGTVFLDEIGEIPPKIQVKLLRVLQEREIERVGENKPRPVDIRIIAATNRDLRKEVREGRFREDLFYRLDVYTLSLPPLRDRKQDIPAVAEHLLERLTARTGKEVHGLHGEVFEVFSKHSWPGNVRELENVIESALVRARGDVITVADLPPSFRIAAEREENPEEKIREALVRAGGCVTRAARLLGVHRTTLWRQMRERGWKREDFLPA